MQARPQKYLASAEHLVLSIPLVPQQPPWAREAIGGGAVATKGWPRGMEIDDGFCNLPHAGGLETMILGHHQAGTKISRIGALEVRKVQAETNTKPKMLDLVAPP
jgi:hypothetical protein